ncbi:hypothetical protein UCRPC4_g02453 [Phaeomoniella chlamydospora]|uniref:GAF domain-containing protein n=1 Tax=Phaeomoniella chlamydospora TaxID=158046 RepID=A0A0G2H770_PHACM|nr:hypothetical protein UCRPC4_g02453 [Phaeomoniella chlamydospora]
MQDIQTQIPNLDLSPPPTPDSKEQLVIQLSPWREPLKAGKLEARLETTFPDKPSTKDAPKLLYLNDASERAAYKFSRHTQHAIELSKRHRALLQLNGLIPELGVSIAQTCCKQIHDPYSAGVTERSNDSLSYRQRKGSLAAQGASLGHKKNIVPPHLPSSNDAHRPIPSSPSPSGSSQHHHTPRSPENSRSSLPRASLLSLRQIVNYVSDHDNLVMESPPKLQEYLWLDVPTYPKAKADDHAHGNIWSPLEHTAPGKIAITPLNKSRWRLYPMVGDDSPVCTTKGQHPDDLSPVPRLSMLPDFSQYQGLDELTSSRLLKRIEEPRISNRSRIDSANESLEHKNYDKVTINRPATPTRGGHTTTISEARHVDDDFNHWLQLARESNWQLALQLAMAVEDIHAWYLWLNRYAAGEIALNGSCMPPKTAFMTLPAPMSPSEIQRNHFLPELQILINESDLLSRWDGLKFHIRRLSKALCRPAIVYISLLTPFNECVMASCTRHEILKTLQRVPRGISLGFHAALAANGQACCVEDLAIHPFFHSNPLVETAKVRSYVGLPLTVDGQVAGTLTVLDIVPDSSRSIATAVTAMSKTRRKVEPVLAALVAESRSEFGLSGTNRYRARQGTTEGADRGTVRGEPWEVTKGPFSAQYGLFQPSISKKFWNRLFSKMNGPERNWEESQIYADLVRQPLLAD